MEYDSVEPKRFVHRKLERAEERADLKNPH